jgi:ABC-2 type transport system permease protein
MYTALVRIAFQAQLAYRSQLWAHIFSQFIQVFFKIAVWGSVYGGLARVDGVSLPEMITYAVLAGTVLSAWEWASLIQGIDRVVKSGDIYVFLLKPLQYPLYLLASECGNLGFRLLAVVLPIVLTVGFTHGLLPPASLFHGAMFVVFWALSFVMLFLLSMLFGLLAFWLMTAFSLEWLLQGLLSVLSGSFVPLWFFPPSFARFVLHSPFAWVGFYPVAVYLGKLSPRDVLISLAFGLGWALLLSVGVARLWAKVTRRITVQGG